MIVEIPQLNESELTDEQLTYWAYFTYLPHIGHYYQQFASAQMVKHKVISGVMLFSSPEECERVCSWSGAAIGSGAVEITFQEAKDHSIMSQKEYPHITPVIFFCDGMIEASFFEEHSMDEIKNLSESIKDKMIPSKFVYV